MLHYSATHYFSKETNIGVPAVNVHNSLQFYVLHNKNQTFKFWEQETEEATSRQDLLED